jgi:hypothetical protein
MKKLHVILAVLVLAGTISGIAWARPPRAQVATVEVEMVDLIKQELIVTLDGEPITIKWSDRTRFVCNDSATDHSDLRPGMEIVISYRTPAFGDRQATRIEVCGGS